VNPAVQLSFAGKLLVATKPHDVDVYRMILLVHSTKDLAGINIAKSIHQKLSFKETGKLYQETPVYTTEINRKQVTHVTLKEEAVNAQNLPETFPSAELIVFISRHSSQSGKPTLSVHAPGNFASAELGGLPRQVSTAPANAMQIALKTLSRERTENNLNYEVSYECTHHGPSLQIPTMFVELGSSEKQWLDTVAAEAVAKAAMESIADFGNFANVAVLGIGGTHYNQKFTRMALAGDEAFGHMIPKYAIPQIDAEILLQCVMRTQEKVEYAFLDWKGIKSEDKPKLTAALIEIGLQVKNV
jgi:D-aminoacyl-tRNA deacylase